MECCLSKRNLVIGQLFINSILHAIAMWVHFPHNKGCHAWVAGGLLDNGAYLGNFKILIWLYCLQPLNIENLIYYITYVYIQWYNLCKRWRKMLFDFKVMQFLHYIICAVKLIF